MGREKGEEAVQAGRRTVLRGLLAAGGAMTLAGCGAMGMGSAMGTGGYADAWFLEQRRLEPLPAARR